MHHFSISHVRVRTTPLHSFFSHAKNRSKSSLSSSPLVEEKMYSFLSFAKPSDFQQDGQASHDLSDVNYYKSVEALSKFFCHEGSSLKEVNDPRIKELLQLLSSKCQISFDYIGYKFMQMYEDVKTKLKDALKEFDGQISLAVDILRSGKRYNCGSEYLSLTAYFIDNWELQKWTLSFSLIGSEGAGAPHDIIIKSLKDWDIERKVTSITMVNCDHYEQTLKVVKDHIHGMKALPLNGQLFKLNCSADVVNQMVQTAYERISSIVERISKYYDFKDATQTWKIRSTLLKDSFKYKVFCSSEKLRAMGLPQEKDWKKVNDIIDLVDDIYDIVYMPFESRCPTANIFLPHLQELLSYLMQKSTNANAFTRSVAEIMLRKFKDYMKEMYLVFAVAAVMDPRFKMKYLEFSSPKIDGDYADSQVKMVLKAVRNLYDEYANRYPVKEKPKGSSACGSAKKARHREPPSCIQLAVELGAISICDEWVGHDLLKEYNKSILSTTHPTKSELECYLEEPVIPWSKDFDTLRWWKDSGSRFPTLSRMARDLMAIPGCVAVGDEATLMKRRKANYCVISSGPELMNAFVCIRDWFLKE